MVSLNLKYFSNGRIFKALIINKNEIPRKGEANIAMALGKKWEEVEAETNESECSLAIPLVE